MMNRRKAREYAFILLFEYKFQPDEIFDLMESFFNEYDAGDQKDYIRSVVEGTIANIDEIDSLVNEYSKGWSVDRISSVCMAVMRLAIYEIKYVDSIPANVSVNEAVNIAKIYDGDSAAPFINGILGNIKEVC